MKTWVTNGPVADFFTVMCQTDPAKKFRGLNFFFVPRDTPGVKSSPAFPCVGTWSTELNEVSFTDVVVPSYHMFIPEGQKFGPKCPVCSLGGPLHTENA